MRSTFAAMFFGAALFAVTATAAEFAPVPGDEQDLIFFHDTRPYLLRLHVQIDGRPLSESWEKYLGELFRYLDRNADGSLDGKELRLAPSVSQLTQQVGGMVTVEPAPAPEVADIDVKPRDGKITPEELSGYYRRSTGGPLQVEFSWRQGDAEPLSTALFSRLDRDKDGKLSRDELAGENVRRLDLDDNEMVSPLEIAPRDPDPGLVVHEPTPEKPFPPAVRLLPTTRDDPQAPVVKRMLARYDADKNGVLSAGEINLDREEFTALDADGDGTLDEKELAKWSRRPPDLEVLVALGRKPGADSVVVVPAAGSGHRLAATSVPETGGQSVLAGAVRLEMLTRLGQDASLDAGRRDAEGLFSKADGDDDTVLDTQEIYRDPFEFVGLLRLADSNGDDKLSRKELTEYFALQSKLLSCSTCMTLSERGRSLFELLDRDHDARLNLRESATAWERLKGFDADGDGAIAPAELPPQLFLTMSHGQTRPMTPGVDRLAYGRMLQYGDRQRGPLWYRKMDRNRDGDVSRREFLGPTEDFVKLDLDADGSVTIEEAMKAEEGRKK